MHPVRPGKDKDIVYVQVNVHKSSVIQASEDQDQRDKMLNLMFASTTTDFLVSV